MGARLPFQGSPARRSGSRQANIDGEDAAMDGAGLVGDEEGGERRDDPGLAVAPGRDRRRGRLADRRGVAGGSPGSVIPAKAGIHASGVLGAFAGEATRLRRTPMRMSRSAGQSPSSPLPWGEVDGRRPAGEGVGNHPEGLHPSPGASLRPLPLGEVRATDAPGRVGGRGRGPVAFFTSPVGRGRRPQAGG